MLGALASCFAWLMCTLATGAVAALVALWFEVQACWPLLALTAPLVWVLGLCGSLHRRHAAWSAAAAVLLAAVYASCLTALARVAAATGYTFGDALRTGGLALVWQVARLGLDVMSVLGFAAATVLGAALAVRLRGRGERRED